MIRVEIILDPSNGGSDRKLYTIEITNIGGTEKIGEYISTVDQENGSRLELPNLLHHRDRGALALVEKVIALHGAITR